MSNQPTIVTVQQARQQIMAAGFAPFQEDEPNDGRSLWFYAGADRYHVTDLEHGQLTFPRSLLTMALEDAVDFLTDTEGA